MAEIHENDYYRLSAEKIDYVRGLVQDLRDGLPTEFRENENLCMFLDTRERDSALAFMSFAMGIQEGDILSPEAKHLSRGHALVGELTGLFGLCDLLDKGSDVRRELCEIFHRVYNIVNAKDIALGLSKPRNIKSDTGY